MIRPFERGYDRQAMRCLMMYLSVRCAAYREPLRHECVSLVRSVSDVSEVSLAPLHVGQLCVRERWGGARRVVVSCGVRCVWTLRYHVSMVLRTSQKVYPYAFGFARTAHMKATVQP